jgi:hypothetical protein
MHLELTTEFLTDLQRLEAWLVLESGNLACIAREASRRPNRDAG